MHRFDLRPFALAIIAFALFCPQLHAQSRGVGADALVLDDDHGHRVTVTLPMMTGAGPYSWILPISPGGVQLTPPVGTTTNSTLYWSGTAWLENTNVLATSSGALTATSITGLTTPLSVQQGGIGVASAAANMIFAGPASGASAAPGFRALVPADIAGLGVEYNTISTQATAAITASNYLFDVAYSTTPADINPRGARISVVNTSTNANMNSGTHDATALTLNAIATPGGTATGLAINTIVDVNNPGTSLGIAVNVGGGSTGNYAATFNGGNVGFGTNNPTQQVYVAGSLASGPTGSADPSIPYCVTVSGQYAYVAENGSDSLAIFDVSNKANPFRIGGLPNIIAPVSLRVSGIYVYIVGGVGGSAALTICDKSNPAKPDLVSSTALGDDPNSVFVVGNEAYVACQGGHLYLYDVSDDSLPVLEATATVGGGLASVFASGGYVYVANSSSSSISIFKELTLDPVQTFSTASAPTSIYVSGKYMYIASSTGNTVTIYDISDPTSPYAIGATSLDAGSDPISIYYSGKKAYTANFGTGTLGVVDVADQSNPTQLGTVPTGTNPASVYVSGNWAYVVNAGSNTLTIVDLGGTYTSSLEAGTVVAHSIDVANSIQAGGGISTQAGLTAHGGHFTGNLSAAGNVHLATRGGSVHTGGDVLVRGNIGIGTNAPKASLDAGNNTDALIVPVGTTAQRPATPVRGMIRFNTTTGKFEGYDGSAWQNLN